MSYKIVTRDKPLEFLEGMITGILYCKKYGTDDIDEILKEVENELDNQMEKLYEEYKRGKTL